MKRGCQLKKRKLLKTVTYIAIKERLFCIITIDLCIMHCRKYHLRNCNRNPRLRNYNKNCQPHLSCRNSHLLNCNRKIHQHTSNKKYYLKTCINATCHLHNCHRKSQLHSSNRNFNLQKWCQPEIRLVTIKKLSKWVITKFKENSFSTPCIT